MALLLTGCGAIKTKNDSLICIGACMYQENESNLEVRNEKRE